MSSPRIVGVYRARNAETVENLLRPALDAGWRAAWWALDEVAPNLAPITVGAGPGEKLPLLNAALTTLEPTGGPLLLSDDDYSFTTGSLVRFLELAAQARLDISQPAHAPGSHVSHGITRAVRRSSARLTTFVESGPLVAIAAAWQHGVLPLPDERGMGWGIELDWMDLQERGCRLGIVDRTTITHLGKVGEDYDDAPLRARLREEFAARGVEDWRPLQQERGIWRPWRRRPPWGSA